MRLGGLSAGSAAIRLEEEQIAGDVPEAAAVRPGAPAPYPAAMGDIPPSPPPAPQNSVALSLIQVRDLHPTLPPPAGPVNIRRLDLDTVPGERYLAELKGGDAQLPGRSAGPRRRPNWLEPALLPTR